MTRITLEKELLRLKRMYIYESKLYGEGFHAVAGVDEAGRGPLAGPVTAAAAILPEFCEILYLNDSKKLSEKRRGLLYPEIRARAVAVGVGVVYESEIDEINIENAVKKAMTLALADLQTRPGFVLFDGCRPPQTVYPFEAIIGGDAKSASIAAASVIAKEYRDALMREYDKKDPGYGFARHKGYGTKAHIEAIGRLGICPIHRKSFIKEEWLQNGPANFFVSV